MDTIGIYEYNSKDLIGHGAFAVVYKGRVKMVRFLFYFLGELLRAVSVAQGIRSCQISMIYYID